MTRFEYNNTVRDLLGDDSKPASAFPAEEKRHGFDNNAAALTVSPQLAEQYLMAAERLAATYIDRSFATIVASNGCGDPANATPSAFEACGKRFVQAFARRAYRRSVAGEDLQALVDVFTAGRMSAAPDGGAASLRNGLRLAVSTVLQSSFFLYRPEIGAAPKAGEKFVRFDPFETATRLSYLLWGSMPDEPLLAAAEQNKLSTRNEIAAHATRMVADKRAHELLARFFSQWLDLDRIATFEKDSKIYPQFTSALPAGLAAEAEKFLEEVTWQGEGTFEAMLTAPFTYVDATLAKFYGYTNYQSPRDSAGKATNAFAKVAVDGVRRGGLLTLGLFLAGLSSANQTSPVKRGQFVRENLLGEHLPPPPPNAVVALPVLDPSLTTRQRFERHASDPGCIGCHALMDPIGLGFESYDGLGQWRDREANKPVDASGEIRGLPWDGRFVGVMELSRKLAASTEARRNVARNWLRFGLGRGEVEGVDDCSLDIVQRRFVGSGSKLRELMVALVDTDAFLYRAVESGAQR